MAFAIQWEIEGQVQISRRLEGLSAHTRDLTVPFRKSADLLLSTFSKDVFATEGAAIGARWPRLSPVTVAQKARLGYSGKGILERTGKMRRSFTSIVASDRAVVYNTAPYFKYHQSNQPRTKMPRRVMMALGENQKAAIVKEFQRYLQQQVARA